MEQLEHINWEQVRQDLNGTGYALVPGLLGKAQCEALIADYPSAGLYRKTVVMERYRFGLGEYKYFSYPLPPLIGELRAGIYPRIAPVANNWMRVLNIDRQFPQSLAELQELCQLQGQTKPTVLILKYGKGGFNTLHQDLYGEVYFPLQLVLFLNEPGLDYQGGEFVLLQQTPRAQSKAVVLQPKKGDMLLFTTNFRPVQGTKGYYRVNMKHGVSEVRSGERHTLGIIFHDALT